MSSTMVKLSPTWPVFAALFFRCSLYSVDCQLQMSSAEQVDPSGQMVHDLYSTIRRAIAYPKLPELVRHVWWRSGSISLMWYQLHDGFGAHIQTNINFAAVLISAIGGRAVLLNSSPKWHLPQPPWHNQGAYNIFVIKCESGSTGLILQKYWSVDLSQKYCQFKNEAAHGRNSSF